MRRDVQCYSPTLFPNQIETDVLTWSMADEPDQHLDSDKEVSGAGVTPARQKAGGRSGEEPTVSATERSVQLPAAPRSRRSNEFWLALAGIAATLLVGLTSSLLAYRSADHQLKAESDRAAASFSREERKRAYADYVNAVADLGRAEFKIRNPPPGGVFGPVDLKQLENLYTEYTQAGDAFSRASATVQLLASPGVEQARKAISERHNKIYDQISAFMEAARAGASHDSEVLIRFDIDLDNSPDLERHFIDGAKMDLGLGG